MHILHVDIVQTSRSALETGIPSFISSWGCWWCNGAGGYFPGTLWTNWALFGHHSLPEYCRWACPSLYDDSVLIFYPTSSRITHHITKPKPSQTGFLNITLCWPPQAPALKPIEHLWDKVERQIHIMDVQCDANMDWKLWGLFPAPRWTLLKAKLSPRFVFHIHVLTFNLLIKISTCMLAAHDISIYSFR